MNLDNQFLGQKRPSIDEEINKNLKTLMKNFSKKLKEKSKCFKLSHSQENGIMQRLIQITKNNSNESLYSVFRQELGLKVLEKIKVINEFNQPIIDLLFSFKKKRKYDIDSNKKHLRKNVWNYIVKVICSLSNVENVKSQNNDIKNNTKKDFEKDLMDTKVKNLYETYYNINIEFIIGKIESQQKETKKTKNTKEVKNSPYEHLDKNEKEKILREFLEKTFKDFFIIYRNSDQFWKDALEDCENDSLKLMKYLNIARKFVNYVNIPVKVSLELVEEDSDLSEEFRQEYLKYSSKIKTEQGDNFVNINHSAKCTDEINYDNTTCSLAKQINSIVSNYSSSHKLETYFQVFKGIGINEQTRLFQSLNDFLISENINMDKLQKNNHSEYLSFKMDKELLNQEYSFSDNYFCVNQYESFLNSDG